MENEKVLNDKNIKAIVNGIIDEAEIDTGSPMKQHDKVVMFALGRIMYETYRTNVGLLVNAKDLYIKESVNFVNSVKNHEKQLSNLSNPISFETPEIASAFNSANSKYNLKFFSYVFTAFFLVVSLHYGYKFYSLSKRVEKVENFIKLNPDLSKKILE